jgi:AraC-like DNA-binding protein
LENEPARERNATGGAGIDPGTRQTAGFGRSKQMILESTRYRIDEHRAQSFLDACRKAGGHLEFRGIRYELTRCADQPQWYTFRIEWESAQQQRRFLEDPAGKAFRDVVNSFERDVEERRQWYLTDVGRRSTAPAGGVPGPLPDRAPWNRLSPWIAEHIQGKIRVEEMAECVNMSPRNFARVFRREFGVPPGEFLDRLRVSAATQDLGDWTQSIEQIAATRGIWQQQHDEAGVPSRGRLRPERVP